MKIQFDVNHQHLAVHDGYYVVSDSENYITASFTFSEDWDELSKTVVFRRCGDIEDNAFSVDLEDGTSCDIPCDVLKYPGLKVYAAGSDGNVVVYTNTEHIKIVKSGMSDTDDIGNETDSEGVSAVIAIDDVLSPESDNPVSSKGLWKEFAKRVTAAELKIALSSLADEVSAHAEAVVLAHPDGSVTTAKIADKSVTADKLAEDSVTNSKIKNGAVTTVCIADGSVTADKIKDKAVTASKIANGVIPTALPADGGNADTVDGKHAADFATAEHTHSQYAQATHNHDAVYSGINHNHDGDYAAKTHTHSQYSQTGHNHDSDYAPKNHIHAQSDITGLAEALSGKAEAEHTHSYDEITGTPPSVGLASAAADGLMSASDKIKLDSISAGAGTGGGIVSETDPTVPDWAKKSEKPDYTASEIMTDGGNSVQEVLNMLNPEENYDDILVLLSECDKGGNMYDFPYETGEEFAIENDLGEDVSVLMYSNDPEWHFSQVLEDGEVYLVKITQRPTTGAEYQHGIIEVIKKAGANTLSDRVTALENAVGDVNAVLEDLLTKGV